MKFFLIIYLVLFLNISFNLFSKKPIQESLLDGQEIYNDFCVQCHLEDGKGIKGIYPPLAKSDFLKDINQTISSIKYGLKGPITVNGEKYNSIMVSQGLDDEEISDVVNYILNSWGNSTNELITEEIVTSIKR
ncbi:MAG: cytochrome C [Flavobacteriaceae bacterium]|nr:cytochrome C [Flavobacteriaceae bacterium]|tara:strand:+ start:116 stop:514 length:399 start_codon:yes stop_codon:yes gene_type:complete